MRTSPLSLNRLDGLGVFALMANALLRHPSKARTIHPPATRAGAARPAASPPQRGWAERLDRWLWTQQQREAEAYLAKASDLCDLEVRIRSLERNGSGRWL